MSHNTRARDAEAIAHEIARKARLLARPVIAYIDTHGIVQTSDSRSGIYARMAGTDKAIGPYTTMVNPEWIKEDLLELQKAAV